MAKTLKNLYYEAELAGLIENKRIEWGLRTTSECVRSILKKEFNCCRRDGCYGFALANGFCQLHSQKKLESKFSEEKIKW